MLVYKLIGRRISNSLNGCAACAWIAFGGITIMVCLFRICVEESQSFSFTYYASSFSSSSLTVFSSFVSFFLFVVYCSSLLVSLTTIAYENIQFLFIERYKSKIVRYKSVVGTCSLDTLTHSRTDLYINLQLQA